jgi:uncharacterized membrane protein
MKSKASIAGHPLHPALVALPVGLIVWAFVADIIYLATSQNPTWYDISYYSGIAAVVTALIAAMPGFLDFFTLARGTNVESIALVHMIANLCTVGLFIAAAVLQYAEGATDGSMLTAVVVLHGLGLGLVSLAGWLGGEMVFRHHVATLEEETQEQEQLATGGAGRAAPRGA